MKIVGQLTMAAVYHYKGIYRFKPGMSLRRRRIALDYFLPESDPAKKIQLIL
jgi:hypothetical protein